MSKEFCMSSLEQPSEGISIYELQTLNQFLKLHGVTSIIDFRPQTVHDCAAIRVGMNRSYTLNPDLSVRVSLAQSGAKRTRAAFDSLVKTLRQSVNKRMDAATSAADLHIEDHDELIARMLSVFDSKPHNPDATPLCSEDHPMALVAHMLGWMSIVYTYHRILNSKRFTEAHPDVLRTLRQLDKHLPTMIPKRGRASKLKWRYPGNDEEAFFLAYFNLTATLESQIALSQYEPDCGD